MIVTKLLSPEFSPKDGTASFDGFTVSWWVATEHDPLSPTGFRYHPRLKEAIEGAGFFIEPADYALYVYPSLNRSINKYIIDNFSAREVIVTGIDVTFSDREKTTILKGLTVALKLHKEREDAKKAAENQMKAVAAIEEFFKPVPVTPVIEEKPSVRKIKPTKEELLGPIVMEVRNG